MVIPEALYRLDELMIRAGWGAHALRVAKRRGLKTYKCGKRISILGSDFIAFVTREDG